MEVLPSQWTNLPLWTQVAIGVFLGQGLIVTLRWYLGQVKMHYDPDALPAYGLTWFPLVCLLPLSAWDFRNWDSILEFVPLAISLISAFLAGICVSALSRPTFAAQQAPTSTSYDREAARADLKKREAVLRDRVASLICVLLTAAHGIFAIRSAVYFAGQGWMG